MDNGHIKTYMDNGHIKTQDEKKTGNVLVMKGYI